MSTKVVNLTLFGEITYLRYHNRRMNYPGGGLAAGFLLPLARDQLMHVLGPARSDELRRFGARSCTVTDRRTVARQARPARASSVSQISMLGGSEVRRVTFRFQTRLADSAAGSPPGGATGYRDCRSLRSAAAASVTRRPLGRGVREALPQLSPSRKPVAA